MDITTLSGPDPPSPDAGRLSGRVSGGVVQEVASDTPDILIKLLDMDSIEEGDSPDHWRVPDVVIADRERFEAYTSGRYTP
jgi:hypothetical protein